MKIFLKLLWIGLVGMLVLTACAQTAAPDQTAPEPAAEVTEMVEVTVADETPESEAPAIDPTDVTLVPNTGRPQFLNSFATW